ncbi:MASE1 domain-containing protein [Methanolobus mangrovi]|uniref:MASE1 domain-containing protein n=1 Tax=Methanolobus mangrovi TaxID=3072977 RepID=A0AA51UGN0_9EURY|nr:MASE1 domain-containing protein [Methanolobus mangrovi]WMW22836.1 MASE1 domain-containing protein [Methanolobus mangrovi]
MPDIESFSRYLNILLFLALVNSLLSRFAVINSPISPAPGVSSMYFAVAFMIVFALWYGIWGAFSAYLGCMIGAGILADVPFSLNVAWSLADLWQVLIPLAAFAYFKVNIRMRTKRDMTIFVLFACVLNNLVGALWGSLMLVTNGVIQWTEFFVTFEGWFIGNLIATLVIVPLLLRYITPYVQQTRSYVQGYWI